MGPHVSKDGQGQTRNVRVRVKKPAKSEQLLRLLLLGTGDSGKTTIFKQLKNSKGTKFTDKERMIHRNGLFLNIVQGMLQIVDCCVDQQLDVEPFNDDIQSLRKLQQLGVGQIELVLELDSKTVDSILKLWESDIIKQVYQDALRDGRYQVADNYQALIEKLQGYPEWGGVEWVPTNDDCMLWRQPTSGVHEEKFIDNKNLISLVDVGGQRSERKKWFNLFENVTGIIFVCSMSEYDQTLFESHEVNRTIESLSLFKAIAEHSAFKQSAFMMFFNKMDLFIDKYKERKVPINSSGLFPDAPLVENDDDNCKQAKNWFRNKFLKDNLDGFAKERMYFPHFTSALDKAQLDVVITECAAHILTLGFSSIGLKLGENRDN